VGIGAVVRNRETGRDEDNRVNDDCIKTDDFNQGAHTPMPSEKPAGVSERRVEKVEGRSRLERQRKSPLFGVITVLKIGVVLDAKTRIESQHEHFGGVHVPRPRLREQIELQFAVSDQPAAESTQRIGIGSGDERWRVGEL
jgi:hypothetical protein